MNYDQGINDLVVAVRGDTALVQPWRNKAAARLEEAQAFIRMGLTTTIEPARFPVPKVTAQDQCICQPLEVNNQCKVHGG